MEYRYVLYAREVEVMRLMYLFDNKLKAYFSKGKKYCNPQDTGVLREGLSCIRQDDVNLWFYTKGGHTIAVDAGHLNFPGVKAEFEKIGLDPEKVGHLFLTHADVDHCGGIDVTGTNLFPNAQVYLGRKEEVYLDGSIYRMKKFGLKINNCVRLKEGYGKLDDEDLVSIGSIRVRALHVPGHTYGHMCYMVDDLVLFSGDCLAVNDEGGYSFFDFFTQDPKMNKESLIRLKKIVENSGVRYVCTGHSGLRTEMEKVFRHIDQSATFSRRAPFDDRAPWDYRSR